MENLSNSTNGCSCCQNETDRYHPYATPVPYRRTKSVPSPSSIPPSGCGTPFLDYFLPALSFDHRNGALTLKDELESCTVAEMATQTDRRVCEYRSADVQDVCSAAGRNVGDRS